MPKLLCMHCRFSALFDQVESSRPNVELYLTDRVGIVVASDTVQFEVIVRNDTVLRALAADAARAEEAAAAAITSSPHVGDDDAARSSRDRAAAASSAAAGHKDLDWLLSLPWSERRVYRSNASPPARRAKAQRDAAVAF